MLSSVPVPPEQIKIIRAGSGSFSRLGNTPVEAEADHGLGYGGLGYGLFLLGAGTDKGGGTKGRENFSSHKR